MDRELLSNYGIDYDVGLRRCMNDEGFYETLLGMFLDDDSFQRGKEAREAEDREALFRCMHELKGASGNVALMDLFNAICPLVELLRGKEPPAWSEVDAMMEKAQAAWERAREGVRAATGKG